MNKLKYLLSAFVLLCFASCKDDPWEDVADGGWNHERSIIDVKFEGQAGTPTITETDSETGVIELQLASDMVADMSKVRVETLTLSYKATANVASGGTITFTDADGNKTSCTLVPKGTYQMPNVPPIPLTLESEAFKFNLKGTEDWNNTYNDYGVFARNPVTYYIEIVKQPAGFEVPEASKTIEEPVDPEPEPEPDPEETSLAGTYSVGRLTVYGGSADPAFVNPVDKSWVWDDSIGKESDNILAMTATGTDDAGRETGECEYLPGEDGGYWNYILKADYNKEGTGALDLTKYYGLLPHGKSAYVYDAEAGTVVFTSGIVSITAKLLREGDYSYGSSTLSVPGIAFDFALPGQTTQGAYPWTDYDRFAVGPRNYVMLFNKQAEAGE